jgi:hypothetical protein
MRRKSRDRRVVMVFLGRVTREQIPRRLSSQEYRRRIASSQVVSRITRTLVPRVVERIVSRFKKRPTVITLRFTLAELVFGLALEEPKRVVATPGDKVRRNRHARSYRIIDFATA